MFICIAMLLAGIFPSHNRELSTWAPKDPLKATQRRKNLCLHLLGEIIWHLVSFNQCQHHKRSLSALRVKNKPLFKEGESTNPKCMGNQRINPFFNSRHTFYTTLFLNSKICFGKDVEKAAMWMTGEA
jgi:hypothetical protein